MPQSAKDKTQIETLRSLASACTKMADVLEKEEPTEAEIEQATGAFMIAIMKIQSL
jgi:hypothetical protein